MQRALSLAPGPGPPLPGARSPLPCVPRGFERGSIQCDPDHVSATRRLARRIRTLSIRRNPRMSARRSMPLSAPGEVPAARRWGCAWEKCVPHHERDGRIRTFYFLSSQLPLLIREAGGPNGSFEYFGDVNRTAQGRSQRGERSGEGRSAAGQRLRAYTRTNSQQASGARARWYGRVFRERKGRDLVFLY